MFYPPLNIFRERTEYPAIYLANQPYVTGDDIFLSLGLELLSGIRVCSLVLAMFYSGLSKGECAALRSFA